MAHVGGTIGARRTGRPLDPSKGDAVDGSFPDSFQFRLARSPDARWRVTLTGRLDRATGAVFLGAANAMPASLSVDVDVADVTGSNTAGADALVAFARTRSARPRLLGASPSLIEMLDRTETEAAAFTLDTDRTERLQMLCATSAVLREDSRRLRVECVALRRQLEHPA